MLQAITDGPVRGVLRKLGYSRSKGLAALQARIEADISVLHAECIRVKAQKERAKAGPARDYRWAGGPEVGSEHIDHVVGL